MLNTTRRSSLWSLVLRRAGLAALLLLFPFLIWYAGRTGFASLLSSYAASVNQIEPANAAVRVDSNDPEPHLVRGAILEAAEDLPGAISEYLAAVRLRPDDYALWLSLARAQELAGDLSDAVSSARKAIPLAPAYAQPQWQLGNLLIRSGQRDEGFKELRSAGTSDPKLLPGIIELAWQLSDGDVQFVKQAIQPQTSYAYQAVAESFRKHDRIEDAVSMFGGTGADARLAREQYLTELISRKQFIAAYSLQFQGTPGGTNGGSGLIIDPGFEQESDLEGEGFGWRTQNQAPSLSRSLDTSNPLEGHSSLSIEFKGASDPAPNIVSQLVLVEPRTRYQLQFAARTERIVSGALPTITVTDAGKSVVLASVVLQQQSNGWQHYEIGFVSAEGTTAVQISLHREPCRTPPCPIFGRMWLDDFSLKVMQ
jgi:tetratricopeptide (TPR) repeat protein